MPLECIFFAQIQFVMPQITRLTSAHFHSDIFTSKHNDPQNRRSAQSGSKISTSNQIGLLVTISTQSAKMVIFGAVQNGLLLPVTAYSGLRNSLNCPVWTTQVQRSLHKSGGCLFRPVRDHRGLFQPTSRLLKEFEGRESGGGIRLFAMQNAGGLAQAGRKREPAMPVAGIEVPV